ncbi:hypothetical protein DB30_02864 [Enhygromyxa salina]|uniref:Uncharacterized protein n=1 Tax=Enhygromyxa salina TaxID=215803 RepID=A0A0C1ZLN3_9BACT|nr:hypothetical protein DB30_02864 [Enhygromyxa salina]
MREGVGARWVGLAARDVGRSEAREDDSEGTIAQELRG